MEKIIKGHAGSLHGNFLSIYTENDGVFDVEIKDIETQWKLYCNDVDISFQDGKMVITDGETSVISGVYERYKNKHELLKSFFTE